MEVCSHFPCPVHIIIPDYMSTLHVYMYFNHLRLQKHHQDRTVEKYFYKVLHQYKSVYVRKCFLQYKRSKC